MASQAVNHASPRAAIAASPAHHATAVGTLELQHDLARAIALEPFIGNRRA